MGRFLAPLCLWLVGGCSFLYNPDHIHEVDAQLDAMVDANPADLTIAGVDSPTLLEGQGDEGSRQAVLVIHGANILNTATVQVTPQSGTVMLEVGAPVVSSQSDLIAVPVTAHVDATLAGSTSVMLDVKVSQFAGTGQVDASTTWKLQGLDELTGTTAVDTTVMPPKLYSRVGVTTLNHTGTGPLLVRATASIAVTNAIDVSASNTASASTPGPGGGPGGLADGDGGGPSPGKRGASGTTGPEGGGGAGFATAGGDGGSNPASGGAFTGDALITSYLSNGSSGGGGAAVFGGAGGGTIELTAGGTLSVAAISSKGAPGKSSAVLTAAGGGGSGGVIVLRSGATVTLGGMLAVDGGAGGTSSITLGAGDGGAGRSGRARVDAVMAPANLGPAHRGVMIDAAAPVVTRMATPMLHFVGSMGDSFDVHRASTSFVSMGVKTIDFGGASELDDTPPVLVPGFNRICVVPNGSGLGNPESRNCIDLAYVP